MRKRWPWILLGLLFGCPCLLTGIGLMVTRHSFSVVADTLQQELSLARREGIPTEVADLRQMAAVPPQDNAASEYRKAIALLKSAAVKSSSHAIDVFIRGQETPDERVEVLAELKKAGPAMAAFEKASEKPGVDWDRHWEDGQLVLFPEYASLKSISIVLCAEARRLADSGQPVDGIRLISVAHRIGWHSGQDPNLIAALVSLAIDQIASSALLQILSDHHDEAALRSARQAMSVIPPLPKMDRAMAGEMILERLSIQNFDRFLAQAESSDYNPYSGFPERWLVRDKEFLKAWEAKVVHYDLRATLALRDAKDWASTRAALDKIGQAQDADRSIENLLNTDSVSGQMANASAHALAYRHIVNTAIWILDRRLKSGKLTTSLPTASDQTNDPFSLKSLGYKVTKRGFKLYTVDSDGVDDGGLTRREDKAGKSKTHDIAFSFR